ncbi:PglZ domain-containing protein [Ruminiclostridium cellobioparum]|uniref:PglZ domain-containing protein n=1 Tax=Ruminiclostridium cellobioparum TaxID=29355 RepID=UPI0028ABD665|nr:PglZ domain-containing protein [Ruminiclostridium cellobioparum]
MNISISTIINNEIDSLFKTTTIVVWSDIDKLFEEEFQKYQQASVNKITFEGSFLELRNKILHTDKDLSQKWIIYCNVHDGQGFLKEFQYFGTAFTISMKDILEKHYRIDFSRFEVTNLAEQLRMVKKLWDSLPEEAVRNLTPDSLTDIVLTKGFGYIDLNKEYSILKYICETDKYESILSETGTKKEFESLLKDEYGIDISLYSDSKEQVNAIVETLFQCEVVQKNRRKDIKPLQRELLNPNKLINCIQLIETWAKHEEYKNTFVEFSRSISEHYLLKVITVVGLDEILNLEYWYGVEQILYKKLEVQVFTPSDSNTLTVNEIVMSNIYNIGKDTTTSQSSLTGALKGWALEVNIDITKLKQNLHEYKTFADIRRRYYFSRTGKFKKWTILYNIFSSLELLFEFDAEISNISDSADGLIKQYQDSGWWKIDLLYRKIQEDYSETDDFITKLLKVVNNKYNYEFLKIINERFSGLIDSRYDYEFETGIQAEFWSKFISKYDKPCAVIIADALRFEMGKEIFDILSDTYTKKITSLVASLPSVTEIGMASLLPGVRLDIGVSGEKLQIHEYEKSHVLNNKEQRLDYFFEMAGNTAITYNLNEFWDKPLETVKNETVGKKRVVIFSSEIDNAGHIEDSSVQLFPTLLSKITAVIKKVINAGINRVVVVSDHGFILTNGLEEWKKVEVPKELKGIAKKRRYIASTSKVEGNYITKSSSSLGHEGNLYFNFPRGVQVFPYSGGAMFLHGGISLQEMIIPVIEIENITYAETKITSAGEQLSLMDLGVIGQSKTTVKAAGTPKSVTERIQVYLEEMQTLNKKERKVLTLFMEYASLTDSDIQEICEKDGIKFKTQTVPEFMSKFISDLKAQGNDWLNFRMVGISVREYYLK